MKYLLAVFAIIALFSLPARSQEGEIQSVIDLQITALQSDDFETAFGFAAPGLQLYFKSPENFGQMVRNGYPMVYRPLSYSFDKLMERAGSSYQYVLIEGQDGILYMAEYTMLKTEAGWKINGVRVYRTKSVGA